MSKKFQELIESERPVLIDFFATWCQPCKVQSSVLNSVKENVGDTARIVKIDIDQYPQLWLSIKMENYYGKKVEFTM